MIKLHTCYKYTLKKKTCFKLKECTSNDALYVLYMSHISNIILNVISISGRWMNFYYIFTITKSINTKLNSTQILIILI